MAAADVTAADVTAVDVTAVDVTPDRSLFKKIGLAGYRTEQAVAELVDNSIDARVRGRTAHIDVELDFADGEIEVRDDCSGMTLEGLRNAMTIAAGGGKGGESLGKFGMGMKSACSALGRRFSVTTAREGAKKEHAVVYDEDEWLAGGSREWKFDVRSAEKNKPRSGTVVKVEMLSVPLYPNQATNFRRRFGMRYGPYLERGEVALRVNSRGCAPAETELDGERSPFEIALADGNRITGWVGLLKRRSVKGDYGIHLYRRGRLVRAFEKFGIGSHPSAAKTVGEAHLDHVPVNFHKTGFIEDSPEYAEAEAAFRKDPAVARALRESARSGKGGGAAEIGRFLGGPAGGARIAARVSSDAAGRMLGEAGSFVVKGLPGKAEMRFVSGGPALYSAEKDGDTLMITVNRDSRAFQTVKNPLSLIGVIKSEAGLAMEEPGRHERFLEARNRAWLDLAPRGAGRDSDHLPGAAGRRRGPVAPDYSLDQRLIGVHDLLEERFPHPFQFTGLSTLAPFLHNTYAVMVYNVQTARGSGAELQEMVAEGIGGEEEPVVLHEPGRREMATAVSLTRGKPIVVIRERAEEPVTTWASPEKAWLDLFFEVEGRGTRVYRDELAPMLAELVDANHVDLGRLESLAKRRRLLGKVRGHLEAAGR